jgi:MoaA/NifB/PqqE/SkfB family radical SAM enzyme
MLFFRSMIENILHEELPAVTQPFLNNLFKNKNYITKKILNLFVNRIEKRLKKNYLFSYPFYLVIDPTNICNLKCPLCPTWQDIKARPKGKMDMEMFRNILDETGPYLFAVNLCNWGEPFLNPELPEMVRYAKKYNTVVGLSTNLNHLPDRTAQELVSSEIDIIVISLDGAKDESYTRYREGGDFSTVLGNIGKLNSYRQNNKKFPLLIWQFLVNKYNEHEIGMAREMSQKMGLQFTPSPMRTSMGKELLLPLYERVKEMKDWLPHNPSYNKYPYDIRPETRTSQTTCKWLWNSAVVNWDGSISPCCGVFEKKWDFHTCYDASLEKTATFHEAWNSPRYKLARKLVAAYMKKSEGLESLLQRSQNEGVICSKCIRYGFLED